MTGDTYNIELSEEDAALFRLFMQHRQAFVVLLKAKMFELRGAHAIVHFDLQGKIRRIEAKHDLYDERNHDHELEEQLRTAQIFPGDN